MLIRVFIAVDCATGRGECKGRVFWIESCAVECTVPNYLRPCRGLIDSVMPSTGSASLGCARTTLHPWLHVVAPLGLGRIKSAIEFDEIVGSLIDPLRRMSALVWQHADAALFVRAGDQVVEDDADDRGDAHSRLPDGFDDAAYAFR